MVYGNVSRFQVIGRVLRRNLFEASGFVMESGSKLLDYGVSTFNPKRLLGPTADMVAKDIDLSGKNCLITGGSSGIGLEITKCMSDRNCEMLLACRNPYATMQVAKKFLKDNDQLKLFEVNLASLASVKKCADDILEKIEKLDIVILNAGVFGGPWMLTEDGLETTFQVNYLSHYYLLSKIEKLLAPNARVIVVASESHRYVNWDLTSALMPSEENLSLPPNEYTTIRSYNVSKLCSLLMCQYLKYQWLNTDKSIFAIHPGSFVKTNLCQNWWVYEALYTMMKPFSKTVQQAASTAMFVATNPDITNLAAVYYKDCAPSAESALAADRHLAFRITELTADMLRARVDDFTPLAQQSTVVDEYDRLRFDDLLSNPGLPLHTVVAAAPTAHKHTDQKDVNDLVMN